MLSVNRRWHIWALAVGLLIVVAILFVRVGRDGEVGTKAAREGEVASGSHSTLGLASLEEHIAQADAVARVEL